MKQISTIELRTLTALFSDRDQQLKQRIASLDFSEVEESTFELTVSDIKEQILLYPAIIGTPRILNYEGTTVPVSPYLNPMAGLTGGRSSANIITVGYPFSGSPELFYYRADGGELPNKMIFLPEFNTIEVEVILSTIDKEMALNQASMEMATTFLLIRQNNQSIQEWSARIALQIEAMAKKKRDDLDELFK